MDPWTQYWDEFDRLCLSLEQRGGSDLVRSLRDSQRYVNGLTDGCWDLLERFRTISKEAENDLLLDERELIATLEISLYQALTNR